MSKAKATVRLTVGQAIVKYLQAQFSERDGQARRLIPAVFGIFGHGNVAGLGQALYEHGAELPYHHCWNEQAMVHTAAGYAKANRRLATLAEATPAVRALLDRTVAEFNGAPCVPGSFDLLWQELIQRHGKQHGTRHMIQVIGLGKQFGYEALSNTVEECLRIRCADVEAIRHLLMRDGLKRQDPEPIDIGGLMRFETPMPLLHDYDRLLTAEVLR